MTAKEKEKLCLILDLIIQSIATIIGFDTAKLIINHINEFLEMNNDR